MHDTNSHTAGYKKQAGSDKVCLRKEKREGYAYESCSQVIEYAFGELHAHKIFAESTDLVKSVPLMQKLGMTKEGVQRSHTKDNAGNWTDMHLYGLLKEEFFDF